MARQHHDRRLTRRRLIQAGGAGAAALGAGGCAVLGDGDDGNGDGQRMNTLLIVTDSTRADYVGAYGGGGRVKTPNIDALAGEGLRFTRAVPEAMPTVAMRRALLTGVRAYPFRDWKVTDKLPPFPGWSPIPEHHPLFPLVMRRAGVTTAYVTDNPFLVGPRFKDFRRTLDFSRSFFDQAEYRSYNRPLPRDRLASKGEIEEFLLPALDGTSTEQRLRELVGAARGRRGEREYAAARVMRAGMKLLERLKDRGPFFLGVDAFDPHEAFDAPTGYVRRFGEPGEIEPILPFKAPFSRLEQLDISDELLERARDLYAAEMTFADAWIGRLINKLDDLGLAETTAVIYLSDHGIYLGERGIVGKYAPMIHREIYEVPFIVRHPEGRRGGATSDWFASTHDVAPTLLSFHGVGVPGRMDGEDLTVLFDEREPPARAVWTTCYATSVAAGDGRWVLISDNQGESRRLFDREHDPKELRDVAERHPDVVERLWRRILADAGGTMPVFGEKEVVSG